MTTEIITPQDPTTEISGDLAPGVDSGAFAITNVRQLQWAAKMAAESRLFGAVTKEQAGIIMWKSLRLSVDPFVGLEHIHVINGKPRPDGLLVAYLIKRSPLVRRDSWRVERSKTECTISVDLRSGSTVTQTVRLADIHEIDRKKDNWQKYPERMLYWRCVALMGQTYFEDQMLGMLPMADEGTIIDIDAVQAEAGVDLSGERCPKCNRKGTLRLLPNRNGGAFVNCSSCGENSAPPQPVRDTLRGRSDEFASTAVATPDAPSVDANDSAVQSESEREIIGEQDQTGEPERPIPEPADPEDSAKQRHQDVRNAIYSHWSRPRPADLKIEMRGLLNEFGWDGGLTLGDWLLQQDLEKLDKITDALASFR